MGNISLPVGRGSLDNCIGVMRGRSFLSAHLSGQDTNLESMLQPPLYLAESTRALSVLEQFKQTGVHLALVTDEYGGVAGLVTLNDLMEAIVGDLPALEDHEDPPVVQREDGSWLMDGSLDIHDFQAVVEQASVLAVAAGNFHTLGGFVLHFFGRIPQAGDRFD